jgi:Mce-associated membrane protein
MAEHDGAAEQAEAIDTAELDADDSAAEDVDADDIEAEDATADVTEEAADRDIKKPERQWLSGIRGPIAVGVTIIVSLAGLGAWLGYRVYQDRQEQAQRNLYVQIARQTAVNLTTISYTEVDADIKRVLDSATGAFHDDFQKRSQPFVEVIKKVQSKSEGTIAEAGLLSYTKNQGQVLVAIAVKTSMAAAPVDPEPRRWRMRLTVDKTGDSAKVSNVEFVP